MSRKERWGASLGLSVLLVAMGWRWLWPSIESIDWSPEELPTLDDQRITALAEQDDAARADLETGDEPDLPPAETAATVTAEDLPHEPLDAEAEIERDRLLEAAEQAMAVKHWLQPEDDNALALFTQVLALDPGQTKARIGREALLDSLFNEAGNALDEGDDTLARDLVDALDLHQLSDRRLPAMAKRISVLPEIKQLLAQAAERIAQEQLLEPDGASALDSYRAALQRDGRNRPSLKGLDDLAAGLLDQALAAASNVDFVAADSLLAEATAIAPGNKRLSEASERIAQFKLRRVNDLIERAELALKARDRQRAETLLVDLRALGLESARVADLATRVSNAAIYASYQPGEKFADAFNDRSGDGPNMVVIPIGEFLMGSPENEPLRQANEGPQHAVRIERPFALAKTEVTVAQFRKFINATQYKTDAERGNESSVYDNKTGRITRQGGISWKHDYLGGRAKSGDPVIHVSWNDAQAYADWLTQITGNRYRLPSEAEFEYALRAGSTSSYWWGEGSPQSVVGNLTGERDRSRTKRSWTKSFARYRDGYWGPAPVAQFVANPFGLFDIGGNVSEWVEDCWHANYLRAPDTGEAWVNRGCTGRTLKGGSWGSSPEDVRSAFRMGVAADTRSARIGFRVARDMAP